MAGLLERTEPPSYVGRRERLSVDVDVRRLESDLRRVVQGEIRFDDGSRAHGAPLLSRGGGRASPDSAATSPSC